MARFLHPMAAGTMNVCELLSMPRWMCVWFLMLGMGVGVRAQGVVERAVAALDSGAYGAAVAVLAPLVEAAPAYVDSTWGPGAYWLGRAYAGLGDRGQMQQVWRAGVLALDSVGVFDLRLDAAYLHSLSEEDRIRHPGEAVTLYLNLLAALDGPLAPDEARVLVRHVAQLALILPPDVFRQVCDNAPTVAPSDWSFKPGAGTTLVYWWRSRDPLPATRENERLQEHLVRVAHAEAEYAYPERTSGLDDRGEVYVRYGVPERQITLTFNEPWLVDIVYQPGVAVSASDFPDNEFWRYGHLDQAAYFIFVKKKGYFQVGETFDLIPSVLRFGFSSTPRGVDKATRMIAVLRAIYRQLAPLHPDFEARYSEVENYAMEYLPAFQPGRLKNRTTRGGTPRTNGGPVGTNTAPDVVAQTMLVQGKTADEVARGQRETNVPREATGVFREVEVLPVIARLARFLDDDGTTRTEIYWVPLAGRLAPSKKMRQILEKDSSAALDRYVITLPAVQKTAHYQDRVVNQNRYFVTDLPEGRDATIPVQTMVVRGDTGQYHLALQWDQYLPAPKEGGVVQVGPRLKVGTDLRDSLTALVADRRVLEMSDLKPIFTRTGETGFFDLDDPAQALPYPFSTITPDVTLALYFEAYHLTFGSDDLTHYSVAYEITRSEKKGGLLRFLGGDDESRTASRNTNTGSHSTAREMILLDLNDWEGEGELEIRVRITDETTGQEVERTVTFTVER